MDLPDNTACEFITPKILPAAYKVDGWVDGAEDGRNRIGGTTTQSSPPALLSFLASFYDKIRDRADLGTERSTKGRDRGDTALSGVILRYCD